jgi:hypothetical protein
VVLFNVKVPVTVRLPPTVRFTDVVIAEKVGDPVTFMVPVDAVSVPAEPEPLIFSVLVPVFASVPVTVPPFNANVVAESERVVGANVPPLTVNEPVTAGVVTFIAPEVTVRFAMVAVVPVTVPPSTVRFTSVAKPAGMATVPCFTYRFVITGVVGRVTVPVE